MKAIKFRAWHKKNRNMIQIFDSECQTEWFLPNLSEDYEVMQYTGLKDKNGKEIFEGDIVEGHTFDEQIDKKQVGSIEYSEGRHGFIFVPNEFKPKNLYYPLFAIVTCELIGNIYENEELL